MLMTATEGKTMKAEQISMQYEISQFLSKRFSGFKLVQSRAGLRPEIRVADCHDIRAAILCEFGVDAAV